MKLRTEMETYVYELADTMDPSGKNTARFKSFFAKMDDRQFYVYMDNFRKNPDMHFPISYEMYNNPVTMDFAHNVAKKRGIPVYERVYRPYVNGNTTNPPGTVEEMMVVDIPVKRLKQMVQSKNHTSTSASKRDARTGQVTGDDKTARVTDVELYSLLSQGLYSAAQESYGAMSDDMGANYDMMRAIQRDGEVELSQLSSRSEDKVTMNTMNVYMIGSCLSCNLVDDTGYLLPSTVKGNDSVKTVIKR